ncbi:MAG TPA: hypothetical protein VNE40_04705 [Candidatus Dormibacteraeota bacterium]|nr:hypothetical protein [Candidatus Dormibacteraeota bacterium]
MNNSDSVNPQQQLVDRLKTASNILVTVSADPSVDQLSACIGLTLLLNKLNKHATAVFSGQIPSTLEFLKPDQTLEKNTDSLRDFIISLDKSKADKLRYKVEDKIVKIFITPYRTSLSADDLEFSQGDFNVDVVVALGVREQQALDLAITAHGRILHDATVATINTSADGGLGSINWHNTTASSLCELVVDLSRGLGPNLLDSQIATALLTGIVAETKRFSNEKTSPQTMSASAELMSAGANQQLVASELEVLPPITGDGQNGDNQSQPANNDSSKPPKQDDGTLEITHNESSKDKPKDKPAEEKKESLDKSATQAPGSKSISSSSLKIKGPRLVTEPPTLGGMLTANSQPEGLDPGLDLLGHKPISEEAPLLNRDQPLSPNSATSKEELAPEELHQPLLPEPVFGSTKENEPMDPQTLAQIEQTVESQHLDSGAPETTNINAARDEVTKALRSSPPENEPIQALNAQPVDLDLHTNDQTASTAFDPTTVGEIYDPTPQDNLQPSNNDSSLSAAGETMPKSTAPPPVPPPLMPPTFMVPPPKQ